MEHPLVSETRRKVERCKGHWPLVQNRADVSRSWLQQFAAGQINNPTVNTLQRVSDACDAVIELLPPLKSEPAAH